MKEFMRRDSSKYGRKMGKGNDEKDKWNYIM